jgi:hypothetical protein
MIDNNTIPAEQYSFKDFLFKNRRNRITLILAAVAIVIQFSIFKYLYPFASYIHGDSFSYIDAAYNNSNINYYLIGYSKFLRLFSVFARPDYLLVAFQYLLIQTSILFLIFTVYYFYQPGKVIKHILLWFMVFNPLFLHLGNLISSDGFFLAVSLIWFGNLLWVIHKPTNKIIWVHAILLFIAFTVRYNAIIYPFIAAIAFWLSDLSLRKKIAGIGLGLLLCGLFVGFTIYQYKKLTGLWQYSPFSGWQFANNAMYAYRYVDSTKRKPVPKQFQVLDNMVRSFFDSTRDVKKFPSEAAMASTFYMWSPRMPLMRYHFNLFNRRKDTSSTELRKWASMGPYYKSYGLFIMKQYPWHFFRYYIYPNANKYYAPPVEFLGNYNSGSERVNDQAKKWFDYKSEKIKTRMAHSKVWILDFYPFLTGTINIIMLFGLLYYIILKGWQINSVFNKILIIAAVLWIVNAFFTIFASSAALRFQSFPIVLTTAFALLIVDWMYKVMQASKSEKNKDEQFNEQFTHQIIA